MANPFKFLLKTTAWRKFATHWMTYFTFRVFGYPKFDLLNYFKIRELLRKNPDEIYAFVGQDRSSLCWKVEHALTGSTWGHAGLIYLGQDGELYIAHVKHEGLLHDTALAYMKEVDRFAVGRIKFHSEEAKQEARGRIKYYDQQDIEYDFELELDEPTGKIPESKLIYCSEYVFRIGHDLAEGFMPSEHLGEKSFTPDNVFNALEPIFEG